jgi:hypothetical protein
MAEDAALVVLMIFAQGGPEAVSEQSLMETAIRRIGPVDNDDASTGASCALVSIDGKVARP